MHEASPKCAHKLPLILLFALCFVGTLDADPPLDADLDLDCAGAISIPLGDPYTDELGGDGRSTCYRLQVDASGVLLASVDSHPAATKLRLRDDLSSARATILPGTDLGHHLILRVREPGSLVFEVAPQDARQGFAGLVFTNRFVAEVDAVELDLKDARPPTFTKEGDEIDPVLLTILDPPLTCVTKEGDEIDPVLLIDLAPPVVFETKEGDEIDQVLLTDPSPAPCVAKEDDEFDPVLFSVRRSDLNLRAVRSGLLLFASGGAALVQAGDEFVLRAETGDSRVRFYDVCDSHPTDDHADFFACASPLGAKGSLLGELDGGWPYDYDVFTFWLGDRRAVIFETGGEVATAGALYDRRGQRLALPEIAGDIPFRFVRNLAPGRYFVRVSGRDGAPGRYTVSFTTSAW